MASSASIFCGRPLLAVLLAMLFAALPGLAIGDEPIPAGLPALAQQQLARVQQKIKDAVLTQIQVDHYGGGRFQTKLTFVSPSTRQAMKTVVGVSGSDMLYQAQGKVPQAVPSGFVDLPAAIASARKTGLQEFDQATLEYWKPGTEKGPERAVWRIVPHGSVGLFFVDAQSGEAKNGTVARQGDSLGQQIDRALNRRYNK